MVAVGSAAAIATVGVFYAFDRRAPSSKRVVRAVSLTAILMVLETGMLLTACGGRVWPATGVVALGAGVTLVMSTCVIHHVSLGEAGRFLCVTGIFLVAIHVFLILVTLFVIQMRSPWGLRGFM
jgi:hypothetical protein